MEVYDRTSPLLGRGVLALDNLGRGGRLVTPLLESERLVAPLLATKRAPVPVPSRVLLFLGIL